MSSSDEDDKTSVNEEQHHADQDSDAEENNENDPDDIYVVGDVCESQYTETLPIFVHYFHKKSGEDKDQDHDADHEKANDQDDTIPGFVQYFHTFKKEKIKPVEEVIVEQPGNVNHEKETTTEHVDMISLQFDAELLPVRLFPLFQYITILPYYSILFLYYHIKKPKRKLLHQKMARKMKRRQKMRVKRG